MPCASSVARTPPVDADLLRCLRLYRDTHAACSCLDLSEPVEGFAAYLLQYDAILSAAYASRVAVWPAVLLRHLAPLPPLPPPPQPSLAPPKSPAACDDGRTTRRGGGGGGGGRDRGGKSDDGAEDAHDRRGCRSTTRCEADDAVSVVSDGTHQRVAVCIDPSLWFNVAGLQAAYLHAVAHGLTTAGFRFEKDDWTSPSASERPSTGTAAAGAACPLDDGLHDGNWRRLVRLLAAALAEAANDDDDDDETARTEGRDAMTATTTTTATKHSSLPPLLVDQPPLRRRGSPRRARRPLHRPRPWHLCCVQQVGALVARFDARCWTIFATPRVAAAIVGNKTRLSSVSSPSKASVSARRFVARVAAAVRCHGRTTTEVLYAEAPAVRPVSCALRRVSDCVALESFLVAKERHDPECDCHSVESYALDRAVALLKEVGRLFDAHFPLDLGTSSVPEPSASPHSTAAMAAMQPSSSLSSSFVVDYGTKTFAAALRAYVASLGRCLARRLALTAARDGGQRQAGDAKAARPVATTGAAAAAAAVTAATSTNKARDVDAWFACTAFLSSWFFDFAYPQLCATTWSTFAETFVDSDCLYMALFPIEFALPGMKSVADGIDAVRAGRALRSGDLLAAVVEDDDNDGRDDGNAGDGSSDVKRPRLHRHQDHGESHRLAVAAHNPTRTRGPLAAREMALALEEKKRRSRWLQHRQEQRGWQSHPRHRRHRLRAVRGTTGGCDDDDDNDDAQSLPSLRSSSSSSSSSSTATSLVRVAWRSEHFGRTGRKADAMAIPFDANLSVAACLDALLTRCEASGKAGVGYHDHYRHHHHRRSRADIDDDDDADDDDDGVFLPLVPAPTLPQTDLYDAWVDGHLVRDLGKGGDGHDVRLGDLVDERGRRDGRGRGSTGEPQLTFTFEPKKVRYRLRYLAARNLSADGDISDRGKSGWDGSSHGRQPAVAVAVVVRGVASTASPLSDVCKDAGVFADPSSRHCQQTRWCAIVNGTAADPWHDRLSLPVNDVCVSLVGPTHRCLSLSPLERCEELEDRLPVADASRTVLETIVDWCDAYGIDMDREFLSCEGVPLQRATTLAAFGADRHLLRVRPLRLRQSARDLPRLRMRLVVRVDGATVRCSSVEVDVAKCLQSSVEKVVRSFVAPGDRWRLLATDGGSGGVANDDGDDDPSRATQKEISGSLRFFQAGLVRGDSLTADIIKAKDKKEPADARRVHFHDVVVISSDDDDDDHDYDHDQVKEVRRQKKEQEEDQKEEEEEEDDADHGGRGGGDGDGDGDRDGDDTDGAEESTDDAGDYEFDSDGYGGDG